VLSTSKKTHLPESYYNIFFKFQKFQKIIFSFFFLFKHFFVKKIGEPQDFFLIDSTYTIYLNYDLAVTITK